jgi:hypothetical protein
VAIYIYVILITEEEHDNTVSSKEGASAKGSSRCRSKIVKLGRFKL